MLEVFELVIRKPPLTSILISLPQLHAIVVENYGQSCLIQLKLRHVHVGRVQLDRERGFQRLLDVL